MPALPTWPTNRKDADELKWRQMSGRWNTNGVYTDFDNFRPYADATGMQIKVGAGAAIIEGFHVETPAFATTLAVATADATNPRIDRVILRLALATPATVSLEVLTGVAAVSPSPPVLRDDATFVDLSLALVRVGAGVSTITAASVTDDRRYSRPAGVPLGHKHLVGPTLDATANGVMAHGIPNLQNRLVHAQAYYRGPSNELRPLFVPYVDGSNIGIGPLNADYVAEAKGRPSVIHLTYVEVPWV